MRETSTTTLAALSGWAKAMEDDFKVRAALAGFNGGPLITMAEVKSLADEFAQMAKGLSMVINTENPN